MNKADLQKWDSLRTAPAAFQEAVPGVFVSPTLREIAITDEARKSDDPRCFPRWFLSALLKAAEAIDEPLRLAVKAWTLYAAFGPPLRSGASDEAEILGSLSAAAAAAGHTVSTLSPAGAGSPTSPPPFAGAGSSPALTSAITSLLGALGTFSSRPSPPPAPCKELNESFSDELLWRWDTQAPRYEALVGSTPVGRVWSAPPSPGFQVLDLPTWRSWSSTADLDEAAESHAPLRESLSEVRRHLQDRRRRRQLLVNPPLARSDVMSWAVESALLRLPLPGGARGRLSRVFDGTYNEPTLRIPSLWASGPVDGPEGLLMRRDRTPFWVELVPAADLPESQARRAVIDAIAAAILGSAFIRSCAAIDPWMKSLIPSRPLRHSDCEGFVYIDEPPLELWLKIEVWLWVARLFGLHSWMKRIEELAADDAAEGFDPEARAQSQVQRQAAAPTTNRAQRDGACAERNEARRALFDALVGLQGSPTPLLLGPRNRRISTFPKRRLGGPSIDLETLIHASCFMLLIDRAGTSPVLGPSGAVKTSVTPAGTGGASIPASSGRTASGGGATLALLQVVDQQRTRFERLLSTFKGWLRESGLDDQEQGEGNDRHWDEEHEDDDAWPWDDDYEHHDDPDDEWFPEGPDRRDESDAERDRRRSRARRFEMDPLGTYSWFHWTEEYGIRLFPTRIARAAGRRRSPLGAVQRFAALLLKVALHEAHHFVEELALSELELSLGPSPTPLFRRWMKRYSRLGGPRNMNEALANADALDRVHWVIRGEGTRALQRYASPALKADPTRASDIDRFLEAFVLAQSGWYRRARYFRRTGTPGGPKVSPKTKSGPMLARYRGRGLLPVDGSDYGVGVALWLLHEVLPLLPAVKRPALNAAELLGPLALSFEGGRSRFEVCEHQLPISLCDMKGGERELLKWLEYCANENRRLL